VGGPHARACCGSDCRTTGPPQDSGQKYAHILQTPSNRRLARNHPAELVADSTRIVRAPVLGRQGKHGDISHIVDSDNYRFPCLVSLPPKFSCCRYESPAPRTTSPQHHSYLLSMHLPGAHHISSSTHKLRRPGCQAGRGGCGATARPGHGRGGDADGRHPAALEAWLADAYPALRLGFGMCVQVTCTRCCCNGCSSGCGAPESVASCMQLLHSHAGGRAEAPCLLEPGHGPLASLRRYRRRHASLAPRRAVVAGQERRGVRVHLCGGGT
jgi:hypothetical protein